LYKFEQIYTLETGQRRGQTRPDGARRRARRKGKRGCPTGARQGPDKARRGGGQKDYLLLKEKLTCSVYMSCKSSSAFDVSEVDVKKFYDD
jgi:hypothetical protein